MHFPAELTATVRGISTALYEYPWQKFGLRQDETVVVTGAQELAVLFAQLWLPQDMLHIISLLCLLHVIPLQPELEPNCRLQKELACLFHYFQWFLFLVVPPSVVYVIEKFSLLVTEASMEQIVKKHVSQIDVLSIADTNRCLESCREDLSQGMLSFVYSPR